jgi:hypothetical protein
VPQYPENWPELARSCKQRAGWKCEECSATENLTAAHINHDPENPTPELRCLCWPCHIRYDAATGNTHPGKKARRLATYRHTQYQRKIAQGAVHRVRMRYLTILWLIGYLPYLYKLLALEQELTRIAVRPESAIERARRISRDVQSGGGRFELDMRLVRIPGTWH